MFGTIRYVHCSASNGLLNFKDDICNLVRPGIILYGYESFSGVKDLIDIKPVCKFKSKITFLKEVDEGTSIGYSRKFITTRKTKIATIPMGYADGIRRSLSNRGRVYINGEYAQIIGNICMDNFMVDVTHIKNIELGDEVVIWDNKNITLEEIANLCNTINYEILCTIGKRVIRKYKGMNYWKKLTYVVK